MVINAPLLFSGNRETQTFKRPIIKIEPGVWKKLRTGERITIELGDSPVKPPPKPRNTLDEADASQEFDSQDDQSAEQEPSASSSYQKP